MFSAKPLSILILSGVAVVGCNRERPDTTKTTTQTETTQVGTTLASTTETKVATAEGATRSVINTYVGTVTVFVAGKTIEVMTGNKEVHAFALDGKSDLLDIDPTVVVGSKVELIEEKGEKGLHRIAISIVPSA